MPPRAEDVLGFGEGVRVADGGCGDGAEADPGLPEPEREVHLVAADEQAHVRQSDLEEDVGADQGAVEEVSVVGQEADLFHLCTLMGDLAAQPEEKGQLVRVAGGHHEGHDGVQPAVLCLAQQRGEASGIGRLGVVIHHPDPVRPAGDGLEDGQREPAGAAKVRLGPDIVHIGVPFATSFDGVVPLSTRQMERTAAVWLLMASSRTASSLGRSNVTAATATEGVIAGSFQHDRQWFSRRRRAV